MTVFKHVLDLEDCNLGSERSSLIPQAIFLSSESFSEIMHYYVTYGAHLSRLLEAAEFHICKKYPYVGRVNLCYINTENDPLCFPSLNIWGICTCRERKKNANISLSTGESTRSPRELVFEYTILYFLMWKILCNKFLSYCSLFQSPLLNIIIISTVLMENLNNSATDIYFNHT